MVGTLKIVIDSCLWENLLLRRWKALFGDLSAVVSMDEDQSISWYSKHLATCDVIQGL